MKKNKQYYQGAQAQRKKESVLGEKKEIWEEGSKKN